MWCGSANENCVLCDYERKDCPSDVTIGDFLFYPASKITLITRLNNGDFPEYRQLLIDALREKHNHEYVENEDLPAVYCKTVPAEVKITENEFFIGVNRALLFKCHCPACGELLLSTEHRVLVEAKGQEYKYCYACGQKLKWD